MSRWVLRTSTTTLVAGCPVAPHLGSLLSKELLNPVPEGDEELLDQ